MANYYHSMEREYIKNSVEGNNIEDTQGQFGISTPPFDDQLQALKVRIRQGVTKIELGFTGTGKGSMGGKSTTPEMYGKDQREAIRELAKINKVELSTHATVGVAGLAGFGERGFRSEVAESTLAELRRAIEFAADTTNGGAIVIHTGEWQRAVSDADTKFSGHPEERKKTPLYLARDDTGIVEAAVPRDKLVWEPVIEGADKITGKPKYKIDPQTGKVEIKAYNYDQIIDKARKEHPEWANKLPEEIFVKKTSESEREQLEAETMRLTSWGERTKREIKELEKQQKMQEQEIQQYIKANVQPSIRINPQTGEKETTFAPLTPEGKKSFQDQLKDTENIILSKKHEEESYEKNAIAYAKQLAEKQQSIEQLKPLEEVGLKRTAETLSRAAMYAYQLEKDKHLEKPLFIAPEAWVPEMWGSHPNEIIKLVEAGRDRMAKELQDKKHMSEEQSSKIASEHIRATIDIGHMFLWRRFFKPEKAMAPEEEDKAFNKWMIDQVKRLNDKNIIGHVHITDNFGYYDEHVTPGQGKAPVKEFVKEMQEATKKSGKEVTFIVEPAHQDLKALTGTLNYLGANVGGLGPWGSVENSYFGHTQPPYFALQDFLPISKDVITSYFGVGFE